MTFQQNLVISTISRGSGDVKEVPGTQGGTFRFAECSGLERLQGEVPAENSQQVILLPLFFHVSFLSFVPFHSN